MIDQKSHPSSGSGEHHGRSARVVGCPRTLLSIEEVAARWGVDRKTVRARIDRGELRRVRVGRLVRIPLGAVESFEQGRVDRQGGTHGGST